MAVHRNSAVQTGRYLELYSEDEISTADICDEANCLATEGKVTKAKRLIDEDSLSGFLTQEMGKIQFLTPCRIVYEDDQDFDPKKVDTRLGIGAFGVTNGHTVLLLC